MPCIPKGGGRPFPGEAFAGAVVADTCSVRSERLPMEEINYSILFRWFVGLNLDEDVWDATTFTNNRNRLNGGRWPRMLKRQSPPTSLACL